MDARDAARLVAPAVDVGGIWADLGAGHGTFTAALANLLGPAGTVYAVERDRSAVTSLETLARRARDQSARIVVMRADFTQPLALPPLDGALLANALHFVPNAEQPGVLRRVAERLASGGRIVVVEYDDRPASRWVPYPVSLARLAQLADEAELRDVRPIGRAESAFGGTMYAAHVGQAIERVRA